MPGLMLESTHRERSGSVPPLMEDFLQDPLEEEEGLEGSEGADQSTQPNLFTQTDLGAVPPDEGLGGQSLGADARHYLDAISGAQEQLEEQAADKDGYTENERETRARHRGNKRRLNEVYEAWGIDTGAKLKGKAKRRRSKQKRRVRKLHKANARAQAEWENPGLEGAALKERQRDIYHQGIGHRRDRDQVRKDGNAALKARLQEQAEGMGGSEKSRSLWVDEQYLNLREYRDGEKGKAGAQAALAKKGAKRAARGRNRELRARQQRLVEGGWISQKKAASNYLESKEYSSKSKAKVQEKREQRRKKRNAQLKAGLKAEGKANGLDKADIKRMYADRKEMSAEGLKAEAKSQRKASVQANNERLRELFTDGDGKLDKLQYYAHAQVSSDKKRKVRNAKLKKQLKKGGSKDWEAEYRGLKVHQADWKENKNLDKAATGVSVGVGAGKGIATAVNKSITSIAGLSGGDAGGFVATERFHDPMPSGNAFDATPVSSGGKSLGKHGGSTQMGAMTKSIAAAGALTSTCIKVAGAADRRHSADPAVKLKAKADIQKGAFGIGKGVVKTAKFTTDTVGEFADAATASGIADMLPGASIVSGAIKMVEAGKKIAEASGRLIKMGKIRDDAKSSGELAVNHALRGLKNADLQLLSSAAVDEALAATEVTAGILRVIPVVNAIGEGLAQAVRGLRVVKQGAMKAVEAVKAGRLNKTDKNIRDIQAQDKANKLSAEDNDRVIKYGKRMLGEDLNVGTQVIIQRAREGSEPALRYLRLFGIHAQDLPASDDGSLRKLIHGRIEADDDPESFLYQIRSAYRGAKDGVKGIKQKLDKRKY